MSTELKPCPFCGGKAGLTSFFHEERQHYPFYGEVICLKCQASVGSTGFSKTAEEAERKAMEAWNRRVNDECRSDRC